MNRPSQFRVVALASLLVFSSAAVRAQQFASSSSRASTLPTASTISTLYSNDPLANTLCLTDGREGGVFQNGEARNRCSHIEFDRYKIGNLSVGIQGGESGTIVDIGNAQDLQTNQAFPGIRYLDGKIVLVKPQIKKAEELARAAQLFETGKNVASIEARPGHIYLARITSPHDKDLQIIVKLIVLSVKPGEAVTFRWELL